MTSVFAISLLEVLVVQFQPSSIVSDEICTACDFNRPGKICLRKLEWVWRGEAFMAKKRFIFLLLDYCWGISGKTISYNCVWMFLNSISDYYHLKRQIESELVDGEDSKFSKSFTDLPKAEQQQKLKERLKKYCQKVYFLDHFLGRKTFVRGSSIIFWFLP